MSGSGPDISRYEKTSYGPDRSFFHFFLRVGFMENRSCALQGHANARAPALGYLGSQCNEQRLNVSPFDVGAYWVLEDCFERLGLFSVQETKSLSPRDVPPLTASRYPSSAFQLANYSISR